MQLKRTVTGLKNSKINRSKHLTTLSSPSGIYLELVFLPKNVNKARDPLII